MCNMTTTQRAKHDGNQKMLLLNISIWKVHRAWGMGNGRRVERWEEKEEGGNGEGWEGRVGRDESC